jgi:hypothetical protein
MPLSVRVVLPFVAQLIGVPARGVMISSASYWNRTAPARGASADGAKTQIIGSQEQDLDAGVPLGFLRDQRGRQPLMLNFNHPAPAGAALGAVMFIGFGVFAELAYVIIRLNLYHQKINRRRATLAPEDRARLDAEDDHVLQSYGF